MGAIPRSRPVLIAVGALGDQISADQTARALARGLVAAGIDVDPCPVVCGSDGIEGADSAAHIGQALERAGFDARMRAARAVLTAIAVLDRRALSGTVLAEVATRARQAGVPCHAVTGRDDLDPFDRRILDLDTVLQGSTPAELERAGGLLAALLAAGS